MGSNKENNLNVFIDSCVLLDIYDLSGPDLDEFKKIAELAKSGKLVIYIPKQVRDEFWRNREGGVADAMKRFKETKVNVILPNLVRSHEQVPLLQEAIKRVGEIVKEITASLESDILNDSLKADEVIAALANEAKIIHTGDSAIEKAKLRVAKGNPPGKKGSLGDAINWECLVEAVPNNENLIVISSDGDYASLLPSTKVKEFLAREWKALKNSEIRPIAKVG